MLINIFQNQCLSSLTGNTRVNPFPKQNWIKSQMKDVCVVLKKIEIVFVLLLPHVFSFICYCYFFFIHPCVGSEFELSFFILLFHCSLYPYHHQVDEFYAVVAIAISFQFLLTINCVFFSHFGETGQWK